jgi:hypothetical protein
LRVSGERFADTLTPVVDISRFPSSSPLAI